MQKKILPFRNSIQMRTVKQNFNDIWHNFWLDWGINDVILICTSVKMSCAWINCFEIIKYSKLKLPLMPMFLMEQNNAFWTVQIQCSRIIEIIFVYYFHTLFFLCLCPIYLINHTFSEFGIKYYTLIEKNNRLPFKLFSFVMYFMYKGWLNK